MAFNTPSRSTSHANAEYSVPGKMVFKSISDFSGGSTTVDASHYHGTGKEPLCISEGIVTPDDISFTCLETEWINFVETMGGLQVLASSAAEFTFEEKVDNLSGFANTTAFERCRYISANKTSSAGADHRTVQVTIKPTRVVLNKNYSNDLAGTILGKASDIVGNVIAGGLEGAVGSLF